ncbi:MAG TPA: GMC family oxidoreductase [Actinomycetes bacterium]
MNERADMVIVGLGAAGGVIAKEMATAGMKVVALEKGGRYAPEDVEIKHDELRYHVRLAISPGMQHDPMTWRPNADTTATVLPWAKGPLGLGPLFVPPSIGVGGGSVHWAAWAWRFRESEFRMRSTLVERFGEQAVEGTTLVDWPISYEDLEPYYERAEYEIGVAGQAGNLNGEIQEGGNPFEPPRRRGYPMPPLRAGAADKVYAKACRRLGYHPFPAPAAINSVEYQGRSPCVYCGFCRDYPCHVQAKGGTAVTHVPAALATGNLEIRPHARVFQVKRGADGMASGVRYFDLVQGREREIDANYIVLSAYALENARLLLVSGINGNGQVGKHYVTHNYGWFTGTLPDWSNPFMGPAVAASVIDDFTAELVDPAEGILWGSPIIGFTGDVQPIEAIRNMPTSVPTFGHEFKEWIRQNYRRLFSLYSQAASFPREEFFCDLDPQVKDAFGQPVLRITHDWVGRDVRDVEYIQGIKRTIAEEMKMTSSWEAPSAPPYHVSTHEVGTYRMGDDPAASVVDRYGRCHEVRNLYAIGGGQFPTYGAYNPTLTIWALAYLTADHLRSELGLHQAASST